MKLLEFAKKFDSEEACQQYLRELREKEGVKCSKCGNLQHYWCESKKRWICRECKHETTLTAGTVMHGSKLPLMYWFTAIHLLTSTKNTFSASEMQRQLNHKRYQPIWEMMHKLRSVMGERDARYKLEGTMELDEAYFSTDNSLDDKAAIKRGVGSQRKSKVLVMIESEPTQPTKKGQKSRRCGHLKMLVINDLKTDTFESKVSENVSPNATVVMDNLASHAGVERVVKESERQTVIGKLASKILPWVHIVISNAKSRFQAMYHGIKSEFLQQYLNEFCYTFNRKDFGERLFDRLMFAAISYLPSFEHRQYRELANCG